MIDIHNHILPFMDDGAADWEASLAMAQDACKDGISTAIATPHHANGAYLNPAPTIEQAVRQLNERLQQAGIPLHMLPGQEIRVYADLLTDLEQGQLLTLAGSRYILLEMPSSRVPRNMEEICHELLIQNLVPVIAHPERNAEVAENPARLERLIELGALGQVTSQSLSGVFGSKLQKLSFELCRRNAVHVIASDAHDSHHRPFGLSEAYAALEKELGSAVSDCFRHNAQRIIANEEINRVIYTSSRNKFQKMFGLFSRKG